MSNFDQVIIKNKTEQVHNVHLAVHPFKLVDEAVYMLDKKGDYGHGWLTELPQSLRELADKLWEGIPGLSTLFFSNGEITLQHTGIFNDEDIVEGAIDIIKPYLETTQALEQITP